MRHVSLVHDTGPKSRAVAIAILLTALLSAACGSSSPASPSPGAATPSAATGTSTVKGRTVDALTGAPLPSITVTADEGASATTDGYGAFELGAADTGTCTVTLSGPGAVPRETQIMTAGGERTLSLIPTRFDLAAFDEMFRSTGALRRWTVAPSLVIVDAVLQFSDLNASTFTATSERLTADERASLKADLEWGLPRATGGNFTAFASVTVESPSAGATVDFFAREGQIVVARFSGLRQTGYVGYGRAASRSDRVVAGAMMLDRDYDAGRTVRCVRVHELGHALGYLHVASRQSFMNSSGVWEPNDFDRDAAVIAFQRAPGTLSPDRDPAAPRAQTQSATMKWGAITP
jgi:hypothetical protein